MPASAQVEGSGTATRLNPTLTVEASVQVVPELSVILPEIVVLLQPLPFCAVAAVLGLGALQNRLFVSSGPSLVATSQ